MFCALCTSNIHLPITALSFPTQSALSEPAGGILVLEESSPEEENTVQSAQQLQSSANSAAKHI